MYEKALPLGAISGQEDNAYMSATTCTKPSTESAQHSNDEDAIKAQPCIGTMELPQLRAVIREWTRSKNWHEPDEQQYRVYRGCEL